MSRWRFENYKRFDDCDMKGVKNSKNLYELLGSTIRGDGLICSHEIEKNMDVASTKKVTFVDLVKRWSN